MTQQTQRGWAALCNRVATSGYAAASRPEKTWLNIRWLIDSIENGGLISSFYNSYADTVADCLDDLASLGATAVRSQVQRVCALFPDPIPTTLLARNKIIDSWAASGRATEIDTLLE